MFADERGVKLTFYHVTPNLTEMHQQLKKKMKKEKKSALAVSRGWKFEEPITEPDN